MRDAVAEDELGADAEGADDGEEEGSGGRADRMGSAEDDGGKAHEAAAGGHAIGEDLQAAQRQLGSAERAEENHRDRTNPEHGMLRREIEDDARLRADHKIG